MIKEPKNLTAKEREDEIAKIMAVAMVRMRATPSRKNFGKNPLILLDYEREGSVGSF